MQGNSTVPQLIVFTEIDLQDQKHIQAWLAKEKADLARNKTVEMVFIKDELLRNKNKLKEVQTMPFELGLNFGPKKNTSS